MNRPEDRDLRGGCPPQDITDPATGGSRLLSERCSTCILRAGDLMYLGPERLRAVIGDALAAGTFVVCHDTLTYGEHMGKVAADATSDAASTGTGFDGADGEPTTLGSPSG